MGGLGVGKWFKVIKWVVSGVLKREGSLGNVFFWSLVSLIFWHPVAWLVRVLVKTESYGKAETLILLKTLLNG